jgi:hypothetical protein
MQHTATSTVNLSQVIAYPSPFRADRGHTSISFKYLTAGSRVRIYDVAGILVRDLSDDNADGWIDWDVRSDGGDKLASGVYLYLVTDPSGNKQTGRIGVIR